MAENASFGLYDPEAETEKSARNLPHWFQPGVAVFITFRTADSMPREVIKQWQDELRQWLCRKGLPLDPTQPLPDPEAIPVKFQAEYKKQRSRLWHWHLDRCHGECLLRRREFAEIVLQALLHFDGQRYDLASAIVVPNHVHLIAQFRPPTTCRKQCKGWLHYTARQINQQLGRRGAFWQSEPFDHLIRSEEQFHYLERYIAENGKRAGLPESDYLYWRR